ncbi:CD276 antigen homolog [Oreochromis niloticus]|uniref:CD276 antigen homolog n=1 Tax=Oreochromis niloticus TaxID=8128 RepID=UPI000673FCE5|nr:CD276 antigen homolog [Oreochromis niloticus]
MAVLNLIQQGLFWTLLCVFFLLSASEEINITAGQDVTLTCRAPNNNNIIAVEWSRADLGSEYVFFYRDGRFDPDHQHPSFKDRVDLQDRQMKDGDVSLILKNVTTADSGTYECRVEMKTNRRKRANLETPSICNFTLSVVAPPGQTGGDAEDGVSRGRPGLVAILSVFGVICVVVAAFVIIGKLKTSNSS